MTHSDPLPTWLAHCKQATDDFLQGWLAQHKTPSCLLEAMRYSLLLGGKRMRPALLYATGELNNKTMAELLHLGAAVECIHAYSLSHDDLPAMDNDDLRRGQPSCHIAYDEATAILVGDGLQALAFELLAENNQFSPEIRIKIVQALAQAAGSQGMVGGQAIDITAAAQTLEALAGMHDMKTGAMLCVSVQIGAIAAGLSEDQIEALTQYGCLLGRAFQVADDCLDVTQSSQVTGKPQHSDRDRHKTTYTSLLGLENAQQEATRLTTEALQAIAGFDHKADRLRELVHFVVKRKF